MICEPRRTPHSASDCVDAKAQRPPEWRHCCCQHRLRVEQVRPHPVEGSPGARERQLRTDLSGLRVTL
jgi:hypothetical protein